MSSLRDYFDLAVPGYIPMGITALLVGVASTIHYIPLSFWFVLPFLSVSFLIAGYNSFNAISDVEIDALNKPSRPLPSKKLTKSEALGASIIEITLSLILAYFVNLVFFGIMILASVLAIVYSFPGINFKKRFGWNTLSAAVLYSIVFPFAGWALYPTLSIPVWVIAILFFYGIGTAVLKDFEDYRGDASYDAETLPVKLGYRESTIFVASSYVFTLILLFFVIGEGLLSLKYLTVGIFPLVGLVNTYQIYSTKLKQVAKSTFVYGLVLIILFELALTILSIY